MTVPEDVTNYVWNSLITLFLGIAGWFIRDAMVQSRKIREDHEAHRLEVARFYASKNDLIRVEDGLKSTLDRLEGKVDKLLEGSRHG